MVHMIIFCGAMSPRKIQYLKDFAKMSSEAILLSSMFPFTKAGAPFIVAAPMRTVSGLSLAMAVSNAGGLGFLGVGYDLDPLEETLARARELYGLSGRNYTSSPPSTEDILPIGVGIIIWNADISLAMRAIAVHCPCAVWLFAPHDADDLDNWVLVLKEHFPYLKIFVQLGSVEELERLLTGRGGAGVDVMVAQGVADAGGHGRAKGASVVGLVPEFIDAIEGLKIRGGMEMNRVLPVIAAGGIMDGRGAAAALALGANGVALGTRFIATPESEAPKGFKQYLINMKDGGQNTVRTRIYDALRGTGGWPQQYNGRAVVNETFRAYEKGMCQATNEELYKKAVVEEDWERLTMFAGTGVGLIKSIQPAAEIVESVRAETVGVLKKKAGEYGGSSDAQIKS